VAQDFVCAATDTHASTFEPLVPIARTTLLTTWKTVKTQGINLSD